MIAAALRLARTGAYRIDRGPNLVTDAAAGPTAAGKKTGTARIPATP
jgi:hypothetical protein